MTERERMCGDKCGYPTKKTADRFIGSKPALRNCHAYECPHCFMWHIGHPTSKYKQRLPKAYRKGKPLGECLKNQKGED